MFDLDLRGSFPKTPHGHIVALPYCTHCSWFAAYEKAWGDWGRENPKSRWPDWLTRYVNEKRGKRG